MVERKPSVSSDADQLILVDAADRVVGHDRKDRCHDGAGVLHRALSVFVFEPQGRLLLQQRSAEKRLWPHFWSNSCCSHPRRGEGTADAARRRLKEELGLNCTPEYVYKFEYRASFADVGVEHELCWVFVVRADLARLAVHPQEISSWKLVEPTELDRDLAQKPERYTPWLQLEWQTLRRDHGAQLDQVTRPAVKHPL